MSPYASCNDCLIVHSTGAGADPELVGGGGGGWSCMLLLHPVLNCADTGPDLCTLHPDLCTLCLQCCHRQQLTVVVFLPQPLAQTSLHPRWFHPLQLAPVVFFLPPPGADTGLTLGQLVLCGGGFGGGGGRCMLMGQWQL